MPTDSDSYQFVTASLTGGCVGQDWTRLYWQRSGQGAGVQPPNPCGSLALLRTCPTPSVDDPRWGAQIINAQRMYCDEHWREHLEREETFLKRFGAVPVAAADTDEEDWEHWHPDAVATRGLYLGSPYGSLFLLFVIFAVSAALGIFLRSLILPDVSSWWANSLAAIGGAVVGAVVVALVSWGIDVLVGRRISPPGKGKA